jgi:hypothetical protein
MDPLRIVHFPLVTRSNAWAKPDALIALTVGTVPSIPNGHGANPKPTWRQPQADVAPNPNPCQLFPIAAHCRFEPFQGLGRSRKRRPAFALAALPMSHKTHTEKVYFKANFSSPRPFALARLRFLTSENS